LLLLLRTLPLLLAGLLSALTLLLLLRLLGALSVPSAWLLALLLAPAASAALLLAIAAALFLPGPAALAGALLELPDFLLHVAARLRVLAGAQLVVTAVRTAPPPLGVSALAARAEYGFRERHRKSARIVHFAPWMKTGAARCWR
jgi:hypothetical protein